MQPIEGLDTPRRDPAPSRLAYKMRRLWLTPFFRQLFRVGIPMGTSFALAFWFLNDSDRREAITDQIAEIRRAVAERPEFMVKLMAIDGASPELGDDIRDVLPVDFPISSFDLNLDQLKVIVEDLDAVATADVRIRSGGILQVEVTERVPAIVWRHRGILELLDATGRRVAALPSRPARGDLPLIVGEGADAAVPEALALIAAAAPLETRLRGLVRIGERRWDAVLDRDQRILLPETGAVQALEHVIALDQTRELLARTVSVVDMRKASRPTVRMSANLQDELHRVRAVDTGDDE